VPFSFGVYIYHSAPEIHQLISTHILHKYREEE
jgi:hypothetical protein